MTILSMGGTSPAKKKELKKEEPKPAKAPKAMKPVHPGLDISTVPDEAWCRRCRAPVTFVEVWGNSLRMGLCSCGLWIKGFRGMVRFIRYDTDEYAIGHEGPMFYQKGERKT